MSDEHLQKSVLAELNWEPGVTAGHIGVSAEQGVVTLTGHVSSYIEKLAAEKAAGRVKGVKAVVEDIEVRLPEHHIRGDDEIASTAVQRLDQDVSVPDNAILVRVENGFVTLSGEVDWNYQRDNALEDIRRLPGVIGISNRVTIRPKVNAAGLSDDITHALHRSWFFDPRLVTVTAQGGTVTLAGTVHTPHDRQIAAATAWAASGVTDVHNEIVIA
jgi:osmotically-inducible protein OsmY